MADQKTAEEKLAALRELVANARSMPMSASCVVNRQDVLAAIDDVIDNLPDEIAEAQDVIETSNDAVAAGEAEAERITEEAKVKAAEIAGETEVVKAAEVKAAEIIAEGRETLVDLGEVNGHLFFNVASIGFSAELAAELTEHAKKRWGTLGYGIVAARLLMRSRLFTAYVDHDDVTEKIRTMQVSVGNGRHYGGGMTVEETATADDGWLDLYSLEVDHWWRLLRLLPSLRRGTQGQWDDVRAFKTTGVTIRTKQPRPVNTDGELVTWTPAHFRIRPKSVRVFAPKG